MAVELPITVGDRYGIVTRWTLDGVALTLTLRWQARASGWYATIADSDGVVRSRGRRVEPGGDLIPDRSWPTLPPGRLVAVGSIDLTRREYLGTQVRLLYLTAAEVGG